MKDSLFDLIIANVTAARKPNYPNAEWGVVAARKRGSPKPLKMKKTSSKIAFDVISFSFERG